MTAFTRIPSRAYCSARPIVKLFTAAFRVVGRARVTDVADRGHRRDAGDRSRLPCRHVRQHVFAGDVAGRNAEIEAALPGGLVELDRPPIAAKPTLLCKMSMRLWDLTMLAASSATAPKSVASQAWAEANPPSPRMISAVSS